MKPFIIVIAHQKGGVGKSIVSVNLVTELSKSYDAHAYDLDDQKSLSVFNHNRDQKLNVKIIDNIEDLSRGLKSNKKLLIIDTVGADSSLTRAALLYADLVITPVSDDDIELTGLMKFKKIMEKIRKTRPDLKAHLLLNKIKWFDKKNIITIREFATAAEELEVFKTVWGDRADFSRCYGSAQSVIEYNKKGKAADELRELIKEIKKHIKG